MDWSQKGTEGRIRVAIREASEDSINIVVEDDGVGFNVNEMDDRKIIRILE
jgi:hypothetical protein